MRTPSTRWLVAAAVAIAVVAAGSLAIVHRPARSRDVLGRLDLEFQNGGLFQFFWNTRGRQNAATLDALTRAGLPDHTRLFGQAMQIFDAEKPQFEEDWKTFDARPDVGIYAAAQSRSKIPSLDAAWRALPPLPT